ncbi:MAG: glycosyltransferase [Bacteroidetes bacterium]|nr:MAG: glycosyltransferase [Bacteroidota bacterium]
MKVLHVTNKPIYPTNDGGRLAMMRLLQNMLHLGYEVKNLTIETPKHPFKQEEFPEDVMNKIQAEAVFIDTRVRFYRVFLSLFSAKSYQVRRFYKKSFEERLISTLREDDYDLVILESAFLLSYLKAIRANSDARILVRTHNVEYKLWRQAIKKERSIFKRFYYRKLANTMKRFELKYLNRVDGILSITVQDHDFFKRRGIKTPMTVIPVHMEPNNDYEVDYDNPDFCFVGSMNWKPNYEAVKWIIKEIGPELYKILPEARIHIAGSNMSRSMKKLKSKNLVIHGRVKDTREFISKHGTMIVPLKSGSGVRIKILEALGVGVPIISTDKGKEGIGIHTKKHFLSANMVEEFLVQMKFLYKSKEERIRLGNNGREFIREDYGLNKISEKLSAFISKKIL